jgi:hypothetical protein
MEYLVAVVDKTERLLDQPPRLLQVHDPLPTCRLDIDSLRHKSSYEELTVLVWCCFCPAMDTTVPLAPPLLPPLARRRWWREYEEAEPAPEEETTPWPHDSSTR